MLEKGDLCSHHCSIIHNTHDRETIELSADKWMDKVSVT